MGKNRITRAQALIGKIVGKGGGAGSFTLTNTVARTDTSAKNLFVLPANATILRVAYFAGAASNAGTTATLSIGKTGTNTFYVNAADVKTAATGQGQVQPNAQNMGAVGTSDIQVVGIYAETGTASSAGGPWTVAIEYMP